jgi:predicted nucleic acid-binding protein
MREVLLDTSIAIESFKNNLVILQHLNAVQAVVNTIVLGELYTGAFLATKAGQQLAYIAGLKANSRVLTCDQGTAEHFGFIKADLQKRGKMIPVNDIWIAATAIQHKLPLAARDAHFENVQGLVVEKW